MHVHRFASLSLFLSSYANVYINYFKWMEFIFVYFSIKIIVIFFIMLEENRRSEKIKFKFHSNIFITRLNMRVK